MIATTVAAISLVGMPASVAMAAEIDAAGGCVAVAADASGAPEVGSMTTSDVTSVVCVPTGKSLGLRPVISASAADAIAPGPLMPPRLMLRTCPLTAGVVDIIIVSWLLRPRLLFSWRRRELELTVTTQPGSAWHCGLFCSCAATVAASCDAGTSIGKL